MQFFQQTYGDYCSSLLYVHAFALGEVRIAQQIQHLFFYLRNSGGNYEKPDYWDKYEVEIRFLFDFNEKFPSEDTAPIIAKDKFFELARHHRTLFPKMPGWEILGEENEWFTSTSTNEVVLKFPANKLDHKFSNDLAVFAWKDLFEKNDGREPVELLFDWENMILRNRIWPRGFLKNLPFDAREKYLQAIIQRIQNEDDLMHPEVEIIKGKLDCYMPNREFFSPDSLPNFSLQAQGFFENFREIEYWEEMFHVFHHQPVRSELNFFLQEIFDFEIQFSAQTFDYNYLKNSEKLLELSQERPALLYTFCKLVREDFPEILPVFFRTNETFSLGCLLIRDLPIRPEILPEWIGDRQLPEEEIRSRIFQIAFEVTLEQLSLKSNARFAGKVVSESLLPLAEKIFRQQGLQTQPLSVSNELRQRFQNASGLLLLNRSSPDFQFLQSPRELSEFAAGFFGCLKDELHLPAWSELVHFNLPELTMRACILGVIRSGRKIFIHDSDWKKLESELVSELISFYEKEFSQREIKVLILSNNDIEKRQIKWLEEPGLLDFFDFEIIQNIEPHLLEQLLDAVRPENFVIPIPPESYTDEEKKNWRPIFKDDFESEILKFRVHFRVALRIYRTLFSKKTQTYQSENWQNAEHEIRKRLQKWVGFCRNDAAAGVFDLFEPLLENHHSSQIPLPTLIQDVAQTVNFFPEEEYRKRIVESLTLGISRLDLLLKFYNEIEDEVCRQYLMKVVQQIDIESFITNQYLWQNIETALIEATNTEPFVEIAERLLVFIQEKDKRRETFFGLELPRFVLEIELVLAFRKSDRDRAKRALEQYENQSSKEYDPEIIRRQLYFNALFLRREGKYGDADKIWEKLAQSENSIEIHYQKLLNVVLSVLYERDELHSNSKILAAWRDWEGFLERNSGVKGFEKYREGIIFCRLAWLTAHEAGAEFDFYVSQLSHSALLEMDVLRLILKNYAQRRNMDLAAGELIAQARRATKGDITRLEALDSLQKMFNPVALRNNIEKFFKDLGALPLEDLVQVVPKQQRRHQTVQQFLLSEFLYVAEELMQKIIAINSIPKENPYNDLFTVLLRARMSYLDFQISDQPREGISNTDAGELDLTIRFGSREIAVYEAFILRNEAETTKHLRKVFNYAPTGKLFFSVVFYKGKPAEFAEKFEEYKSVVKKDTTFATQYALQNGFEKVEDFPDMRNIFLGKTVHGSEGAALMFHLFLNLAMSVEGKAPSSKVKKVKKPH